MTAEKCPECARHVEPTPVGRFRFVCLCGKRWGDKGLPSSVERRFLLGLSEEER